MNSSAVEYLFRPTVPATNDTLSIMTITAIEEYSASCLYMN